MPLAPELWDLELSGVHRQRWPPRERKTPRPWPRGIFFYPSTSLVHDAGSHQLNKLSEAGGTSKFFSGFPGVLLAIY